MSAFGQDSVSSSDSDFNAIAFLVKQALQKIQTATIVQIVNVTNAGGISPVGFVDVIPAVNQMTGNRQSVPHGTIYTLPYLRMQGGANALILDPQKGDLGIALFASRDISVVKATKAIANPGSYRTFDWADGMYLGGLLNGVPTQYVAFAAGGITMHSPTKITIDAPVVEISGGGTKIDGKVFLTHDHTGVTVGGANTGPVG